MGISRKQHGFTVIELTVVMAIVTIIAAVTFNEIRHVVETQRAEETADAIRKIYTGSIDYYNTNTTPNSYDDVSMTAMCDAAYMNQDICDQNGAGNTPWGGDYTATGSGTQIVIKATRVPSTASTYITKELLQDTTITSATYDPNTDNGTVTATYDSNLS